MQESSVLDKAVQLSNIYYNRGLDKAQIRDMSGAVDLLERSLKYNKRNIRARNLLGLVYFEIGEVVAALSEWVISKNMKPEDNVASEYIDQVQANQAWLETIQQTIKRYNRALDACRADETDVAIVMLKKVVAANPHLIKAFHLLALLYMKQGEYEKARKVLKKAAPIDRTNATALRFLKEIDEQTGTVTDRESLSRGVVREERKGFAGLLDRFRKSPQEYRINNGYMTRNWDDEENIITEPVIQPIAFHQLPAFVSLINIIIGIVLGAFIIGLIVVPAVRQNVNRSAEEKVAQYSATLVTQNEHIKRLEDEILVYNEQIDSGNVQISEASKTIEACEMLLNAYISYAAQNFDQARETMQLIDTALLSENALNIYNTVLNDMNSQQFNTYYNEGYNAFQRGNFAIAAPYFVRAKSINPDSYSAMAYLAHCYRLQNMSGEAIAAFQDISEKYPNSQRAATAERYITMIQTGNFMHEVGVTQVNTEIAVGEMEEIQQPQAQETTPAA